MPGELFKDYVLIADESEASAIYNRGYYGTPQSGGSLKLSLIETVYLAETDKIQVFRKNNPITFEELMNVSHRKYPNFEIKYIVYRDLRQRGYVIKLGDNVDFRLYPRGGVPSKTPSKFWVQAITERAVFDLDGLLEHVKKVSELRKELLLGIVDEESDITYYGVKLMKLKGTASGDQEIRKKQITGILMNDRVMISDIVDAEYLHRTEFFGKMVGTKYLQLSLIETAYLMENKNLEVKNSKNNKILDLDSFKRFASKIQKDFELRYKIYKDLKMKGIIVKTGFKYGAHFRGYEKNPDTVHARYLVHAVPKNYVSTWPEISRAVRLAHGVKKDIVFSKASTNSIEYLSLRRLRP